MFDLRTIAKLLGGHVCGKSVLAPGPGHSARDRSMGVWIARDGRLAVNSFSGDDNKFCLRYALGRLGLPMPGGKRVHALPPSKPRERPHGSFVRILNDGTFGVFAVGRSGRDELLITTEFEHLAYELEVRALASKEGFNAVREEGILQKNAEWAEVGQWLHSDEKILPRREQEATAMARKYFAKLAESCERTEPAERAVKPERTGQGERAVMSERTDRPERAVLRERTEKGERL